MISVNNKIIRDFLLGFVSLHILHHAQEEPIYGLGIQQELERHGYHLGPGTLYPLLHRLERAGYVTSSFRVVEGKRRTEYRTSAEGRQVLQEAAQPVWELIREVFPASIQEEKHEGV